MNLNTVIIAGNLTRDPEVKYTASGKAVANLSLAINNKWKAQDGTEKEEVVFVEVQAWGRIAEVIGQHCAKGANLLFQGRLKLDQWEDKQTGAKRSKLYVVADSFQFAGSKSGGSEPEQRQERRTRTPTPASGESTSTSSNEDDDVPF